MTFFAAVALVLATQAGEPPAPLDTEPPAESSAPEAPPSPPPAEAAPAAATSSAPPAEATPLAPAEATPGAPAEATTPSSSPAEEPTPAPAATAPPAASPEPAPAAAPAATPWSRGQLGVGLLATGAVFAAGSAVGLTLVEVLTTPDRERATVDPTTDQFNSIVGFVAAAAASVGAVAMVTGAGLAISDP